MIFIAICVLEFVIILCIICLFIKKYYSREKEYKEKLRETRADAIARSKSIIQGKVFEQIAPYLPQWKYSPSDARFLGTPIDFVIFEGMSEGEVNSITIVEVKTGNSRVTPIQNKVRKAIEEGRVKWETLKIE